ncbi:MAG: DUF308 domain-containing protein [Acidimicrobiia bacterium]|nr:DUF308 domain-containing protein [Acidimicrobiia bacterium]
MSDVGMNEFDDDGEAAAVGHYWWVFGLTGLVVTVFGILLLAVPQTLYAIAVVFGLALLFVGILEVVHGFVLKGTTLWWIYIVRGLVSVGFGIVLIFWPGETATVIAVFAGIYLIIAGIFEFVIVLAVPDADDRGLYVLLSIAAVIVGIFVLRDPERSLRLISLLLGAWFVFFGMLEIVSSFGIRALGKELSDSGADDA